MWTFILDDRETKVVRFADNLAALNAPAGKPHAEAVGMMIAAGIVCIFRSPEFGHRRTAEFACPDDQCGIQ